MANIDFDSLRRQLDIVQVINAEGVSLTKKGKNFVGLCPFHDDTNPSLVVSPEKQIFKCFVCGTAGNVFTFVRDYEKIPFINAVKKACDVAGISVPELQIQNKVPDSPHQRLFDTLTEVRKFYSYCLKISVGAPALEYLRGRKIDDESINKFAIGFCAPSGVDSVKYLLNKEFNLDEVIYSGVGYQKETDVVDRMAGRIVFPIRDEYNRVVGFSGRSINPRQDPKYLNTPDTVLFHKGHILYNYYNCEQVCRRSGVVYLVEGFMDVIAFSRAKLDNVVATMGTALTTEAVQALRKLNCEIRVLFDADNAGQMATYKSLEILKNIPKGIKVVRPFTDLGVKDADELLDRYGENKFLEAINRLENAMDFRLDYLYGQVNPDNYDDRKNFVLQAAQIIGELTDAMDIDHYATKVAQLSNFSLALVKRYVPSAADDIPTSDSFVRQSFARQTQRKMVDRYDRAQRQIIYLLLNDYGAVVEFQRETPFMTNDIYRRLSVYILDFYTKHGQFSKEGILADLLSELPPELAKVVTDLAGERYPPMTTDELFKILKEDYPKKMTLEQDKAKLYEIRDPQEQAKYAKEHLLKEGVLYSTKRKKSKKSGKE